MGLQVVEIIMSLEDHFSVSIPDDVAGQCITIGDMQNVIVDLLASTRKCNTDDLMSEVMDGIVNIVSKEMGMKPSDIKPDSTWVGDITKYG